MTNYLVSFRPLAVSSGGRMALKEFALPPFIDGSCRREPDFESIYPSISALCRKGKFAPKLKIGDEMIYITIKSNFGTRELSHYKLVAHLRVIHCSPTHQEAAVWYQERLLQAPSNCMTTDSKPKPYEQTSGQNGKLWRKYSTQTRLQFWDGIYRKRSKEHGTFIHCEAKLLNLHNPNRLFVEDFEAVFGRMPGTQNPPKITDSQLLELIQKSEQRGSK